jgi:endophilin-A
LGDDSNFGKALFDMGECLRQLAGIKYALEDNVKQNFLDPLSQLKDNELKDVMVSFLLLLFFLASFKRYFV